jgi:hypothetical protein
MMRVRSIMLHELIVSAEGTKRRRAVGPGQKKETEKLISFAELFVCPMRRDHLAVNLAFNIAYAADYVVIGNCEMADALIDLLEIWAKGWLPVGMLKFNRTFVILTKRSVPD